MDQRIREVEPGSIGQELGLEPGDVIASINGEPVVDVVDYLYFSALEELAIEVKPVNGGAPVTVEVEKDSWEPLGLTFDRPMMSPPRGCRNRCLFCFVDQLPPGVRDSLRFKDDDWRMSLMMGNYVTLTNVDDRELERICRRRVSPLYLSVHAADPQLRRRLLGNPKAPDIRKQMERLREAGISFHAQIVLCPGLNDGPALQDTLETLYGLSPACLSVAVVPVGLTRHRKTPLRPVGQEEARQVLAIMASLQQRARREVGKDFAYASDELYLRAGLPLPPAERYDGYPQIENGVGLWRSFEEEFLAAWQLFPGARSRRVGLACGVSIAPLMGELLARLPGEARVYPLENRFFGDSITVTGLLTGGDLLRLREAEVEELLIPRSMLREGERVFLDDRTLEETEAALGKPLRVVDVDGGALFRALCGIKEDEQ